MSREQSSMSYRIPTTAEMQNTEKAACAIAQKSSFTPTHQHSSWNMQFVTTLFLVFMGLSACVIISSCASMSEIFGASDSNKSKESFTECKNFFKGRICNAGFGYFDEKDSKLTYSKDLDRKNLFTSKQMKGDEASLYLANAKVQELKNFYEIIPNYCKTHYSSHYDNCMGFSMQMILKAREAAYLGYVDSAYDHEYFDYNTLVVPENDDVYLTKEIQSYYDALSDQSKSFVHIEEFAMTADQMKAKKSAAINQFIEANYLDAKPHGVKDSKLEAVVIAYLKELNPELTVKNVYFENRWFSYDKRTTTGTVTTTERGGKKRFAVVTVNIPNDNNEYLLGYVIPLVMEYEGGGNYGEPYCRELQGISPLSHEIELYAGDGDYDDDDGFNPGNGIFESISHRDRHFLYNYHNASVYIPIRP